MSVTSSFASLGPAICNKRSYRLRSAGDLKLRSRIADDGGGLRRFVNVYLGGEDIRFLDGLETPVKDGDELTILPAVAGG